MVPFVDTYYRSYHGELRISGRRQDVELKVLCGSGPRYETKKAKEITPYLLRLDFTSMYPLTSE